MARPTFAATASAIFYLDDDPTPSPTQVPKTLLSSIRLDGIDKSAHLRFERAEEAVVSPDERWVATSELHNA